jgi:hypothetical protein
MGAIELSLGCIGFQSTKHHHGGHCPCAEEHQVQRRKGHPSGEVSSKGCISLDEAANLLNIKILQRDALDKNLWMPDSAPPDLPQPLESMWAHQINNMKWMLSKTSLKMG